MPMKSIYALAAYLMLSPWLPLQPASAQSCPPHAHVTGTTREGNVKTVHCGCDAEYVNVDGRCSARTACVNDAGYQLKFELADCQRGKPSLVSLSCFRGIGVSEKALSCIASLPKAGKSKISVLATCGLLGTVPIDAAARCRDISDDCVANALAAHKARIAVCKR